MIKFIKCELDHVSTVVDHKKDVQRNYSFDHDITN